MILKRQDTLGRRKTDKYAGVVWQSEEGHHTACPSCGKTRTFTCRGNAIRSINSGAQCGSCSQKGERGGKKRDYDKNREKVLGKNWADEIKGRDGCCQVCFSTKKLEAHHIFGRAGAWNLRHNLNNGITLCVDCHKEFHSLNGKKQTQFS